MSVPTIRQVNSGRLTDAGLAGAGLFGGGPRRRRYGEA